MEKKRPQLSLDELHQLKWLLGGMLTLLAVWTVFYMDLGGWTLMAITTAVAAACLIWPGLPARVPPLVHTLAFPAIVLFFVGDLWLTTEVLPAMVRLDILLLLYRTISYRQRRDDLQVIVLGLFLIVVAGVLTVSLVFAAQILAYTGCALGFLLAITLTEAVTGGASGQSAGPAQPGVVPAWAAHADWPQLLRRVREVADWRVVALAVGLFAGVVGLSALLFLALPRFQLENSLFLERFVTKKARTGFTDSIKIGDVSEIVQDNGVALSVDVSDRTVVPAVPYWRMLVLDQYDRGTFKLSPGLRLVSIGRERTGTVVHGEAKPRLGPAVYWTFYLESGVSRYLPLAGEFEVLRFRESQNFQLGADLRLLALRNEPVTMTAYRVEGLDPTEMLPDPNFAKRWREHDNRAVARGILQNRVNVSSADQTRLRQLVETIGVGGAASNAARDFADRAGEWLRKNHLYSLTPTIPAGEGDPLVRWMMSTEAGHCELFAGSLVLLARAAGFPARVVTGFKGGSWNGYSNNFTIRNSDAHAWAEIFDEVTGAWLREDALATSSAAQDEAAKGEAAIAARTDRSWAARLDSLRVFWYRRIVNFDQRSQTETLKAVKEATQDAGRRLRERVAQAVAAVKMWLTTPWSVKRVANVLGVVSAAGLIGWIWWEFGRGWWRRLARGPGGKRDDPVRSEASRWLRKMAGRPEPDAAWEETVAQLRRLRFGARATWPDPEKIFRRARRVWREARSIRSTPVRRDRGLL
jgi:protein-glutamine gamma-glutamyltransferase